MTVAGTTTTPVYNLPVVGKFEKVSFDEFKKSVENMKCKPALLNYFGFYESESYPDDLSPRYVKVETRTYITKRFDEYKEDILSNLPSIYNSIQLPKRATKGSAGYDMFPPFKLKTIPFVEYTIPLGIKVYIQPGWAYKIYPRSSSANSNMYLLNTVGLVDSDYYNNPGNEGQLFAKFTFGGPKEFPLDPNVAVCQGVFKTFGVAAGDCDDDLNDRTGGWGSTSSCRRVPLSI